MICQRLEQGWEVITQRNHALLSAEMLADWRAESRPQPWSQLLNACAQHDHGWMEEHLDPLLDDGGSPLDFLSLPFEVTLEIAWRNLRNAEAQSRWCAILVSRHIEYLFRGKDDRQAQDALTELVSQREAWMADLDLHPSRVEELYELLCWADTFSLLLCCPPSDFTRSLELKAQGVTYKAKRERDESCTLAPWPYRREALEFTYETRFLSQDRFPDLEEFRRALRAAPVTQRAIILRPGRE